jgi:hypothetical protein
MKNIDNFLQKTLSEQVDLLTHPSLDKELYNNIIERYSEQISTDLLIASIELHGFKLSSLNIDNLLKMNDKDIMTSLAQNFQIKISINQMRDLTRLVADDIIKQHPDFKEYYDYGGEDRYDVDDVSPSDISNEIVVVDGILLDGYSRVSTLLRNGEKTTYAYVATKK